MKAFLSLLLILPLLVHTPAIAAPAERPNIVIIFIDDLGYADIGPFGATKQKTPNLDRMAEQGMKLTSFYAAPVCSVSRAQLLTGCYGARVSVPGVYGPGSSRGLNPGCLSSAFFPGVGPVRKVWPATFGRTSTCSGIITGA